MTHTQYCPFCLREYGRKKLLFQYEDGTKGKFGIRCRGCKNIIRVEIGEEPVSRK